MCRVSLLVGKQFSILDFPYNLLPLFHLLVLCTQGKTESFTLFFCTAFPVWGTAFSVKCQKVTLSPTGEKKVLTCFFFDTISGSWTDCRLKGCLIGL